MRRRGIVNLRRTQEKEDGKIQAIQAASGLGVEEYTWAEIGKSQPRVSDPPGRDPYVGRQVRAKRTGGEENPIWQNPGDEQHPLREVVKGQCPVCLEQIGRGVNVHVIWCRKKHVGH